MDYCELCDGFVEPRNIRGKIVGYCTDCGNIVDSSQSYQEKEDVSDAKKRAVMKGTNLVKCNYCNHEINKDDNLDYMMDIHKTEAHEEEYMIENASIDELIDLCNNEVYKLAKMALNRIEEDEDLEEVMETARDWQIRVDAVNRISNEDILKNILLNDRSIDVKIAASKKITEPSFSEDNIGEFDNWQIESNLISNVSNKDILRRIILKEPKREVWINAIDNIEDNDILFDIASTVTDMQISKVAIKKITDNSLLISLLSLFNNDNIDILVNTIDNIDDIDDSRLLALFVKKSTNEKLRNTALEKIDDEASLFDIVVNGEFKDQQILASGMISSQEKLILLLSKGLHPEISSHIVRKIDDDDILLQIALEDDTTENCYVATDRLDEERQILVANNARYPHVREFAVSLIDNQQALRKLAISDLMLASICIDRINQNIHLLEIVLRTDDLEVQKQALQKINDVNTLNSIIDKSNNEEVKQIAIRKRDYLNKDI